ncbi:MAG TPA: hypothetical protein VIV12_29750 [Streptosporangiaceae bacterium]
MGDLTVTILDSGDLKALNRAFKKAADGKELRAELRTGLRNVLKPIVPEVRAAFKASPSMGHGGMSRKSRDRADLRVLLAKATRVEVKLTGRQAGARIRVDGRRMPDGLKGIPKAWEAEGGARWRHPAWGNRNVWVQQRSRPLFYRIVAPKGERAAKEIERVANRVVAKLERSVG